MLQKGMGEQIREGKAEFKFAPEEGPGFFTAHGWDVVDVRSTLKTAVRLKRLILRRITALAQDPEPEAGSQRDCV
jgi:hypothetical protein